MKIVVKVSICTSSIVYKFVPTENYFKTKKKDTNVMYLL